jgi:hypothetical protein
VGPVGTGVKDAADGRVDTGTGGGRVDVGIGGGRRTAADAGGSDRGTFRGAGGGSERICFDAPSWPSWDGREGSGGVARVGSGGVVVGVKGGGSFRACTCGATTEDPPRLVGSAGAVFVRSGSGGTKRAAAVTSGFAVLALLGGRGGLNGSASRGGGGGGPFRAGNAGTPARVPVGGGGGGGRLVAGVTDVVGCCSFNSARRARTDGTAEVSISLGIIALYKRERGTLEG